MRSFWIDALRVGLTLALTGASSASVDPPATPGSGGAIRFSDEERARILQHSPLPPPPPDPTNAVADDAGAALLGQRLFFESRLSGGSVSCASCHVPGHGFTDGKPVSQGLGTGLRRTPSLWNAAYHRWFFWDGRKDSLWSQALSPIENDTEMGGDRMSAARLLASDPELRSGYQAVFGALPDLSDHARFPARARPLPGSAQDPRAEAWQRMSPEDQAAIDVVFARIGKAIAAYERRLVSRASPFDRFVADLRAGRESHAVGDGAGRGLKIFVGRGNCRICHSGPSFSDGEFHQIGVPPPADAGRADSGRFGGIDALRADPFNARGRFSDAPSETGADKLRGLRKSPDVWGQFKTPSLRNVALRGPFMHRGQFATLRDVLRFYSTRESAVAGGPNQERILVPLRLSGEETEDLLAFLGSLTDDGIDPALLHPPPASDAAASGVPPRPEQSGTVESERITSPHPPHPGR